MAELYIGLMSGTSLDGVDGVLADFSEGKVAVVGYASTSFATDLRAHLLALNTPGSNELHRAALAANALADSYAGVVQALLAGSGLPAAAVQAIGAHGQTVRHQPQQGYTVQLNNPARLAEHCGITVVADFRSRDVAAGGQGAPLVPAFHQAMFGGGESPVMVLNIGGISNLSVLPAAGSGSNAILGFDCGPGNALLDHWCQQHTRQPFDADGAWAASGQVVPALLNALLAEPFLALPPPKSTGRDLFNPDWLNARLQGFAGLAPQDVQATLTQFTASACAACVSGYGSGSKTLLLCGGGALNGQLVRSLQAALPGVAVLSSAERGLPPLQVEATAFAWLARQTLHGLPGNLPSVTGARGLRVLGAIHSG